MDDDSIMIFEDANGDDSLEVLYDATENTYEVSAYSRFEGTTLNIPKDLYDHLLAYKGLQIS